MADQDYARRCSDAAARNRAPILEVLRRWLPAEGTVLEIASGTGEHAAHYASEFPGLIWQPSDPDPDFRESIAAWAAESGAPNLRPPLDIDTRGPDWGLEQADAILCINMIHIAPWSAAEGLVRGAGRLLPAGGILYLYGPFKRDGKHTAPSNARFDESLRARDPDWGVRDVEAVLALAEDQGIEFAEIVEMPANNLSVILQKG